MVKEKKNLSDRQILKDIFFKSLQLADPLTKLTQIEFNKPKGRVFFASVGKGAGRHAKAFSRNYSGLSEGVVVLPENECCEDIGYKVFKASHPVPSNSGLEASKYLLREAKTLGKDDLFIFCISGGASALLPYPPEEFQLDDEIYLNKVLLSSGLSIKEMNVYRGAFSQIKAGKLAQMVYPCPIINLVVSDIPGDDITLVGSGPTFIPRARLTNSKTPKFGFKIEKYINKILRSNSEENICVNILNSYCLSSSKILFDEASKYIEKVLGLNSIILSSQFEGDVNSLTRLYKNAIKDISSPHSLIKKPAVILSGGEVEIKLPDCYGKGGRNSQFSLALSKEIDGMEGVTVLSADTDGIDGNGENAGAIVDCSTFRWARKYFPEVDPVELFDSYNIHKKLNTLFCTGPTGINLNDFRAAIVR